MRYVLSLLCFLTTPLMAEGESTPIASTHVLLQGLDKVAGRVHEINVPLNHPVKFGTLKITARSCSKAAPEDPPESTAFLEITDESSTQASGLVFQGWMFASTPSVSAMEHPVYDVWVKECTGPAIESTISHIDAVPTKQVEALYQGLNTPDAESAP